MRAALLLVVALALAACGGSSSSTSTITVTTSGSPSGSGGSTDQTSTQTATTTTVSTPTTSATTTVTGTASTTSGSTTPVAGAPACRAADLALSFLGQQGATGHGELGFALRNTSGHTCTTVGYPGVLFLDRGGGTLPTVPIHTTNDFFGATRLATLSVAPGGTVSFRLGVTHGISSPAGCSTAYGLQAIPPNDTATLRTSIPGGAYQCRTATVSPLQPGNSAYP
jgi:hypothetical protein